MAEAISITYTTTAPTLLGVWVFDPTAPDTTDTSFLYADATTRVEDIDPGATVIMLNGRTNPIVDYGVSVELNLKLSIKVPFGPIHDAGVNYWRAVSVNKRTVCYRDGRGRLIYCALSGSLALHDAIDGTVVTFAAVRVDYNAVVT